MSARPDRPERPERWGIPTTVGGVRFRSRLEARWSILFDRLEWSWAYEPTDLRLYVPDFVLLLPTGHLAVEVKPELVFDSLRQHALKIASAGWMKDFLAVGERPFPHDRLGVLGDTKFTGVAGETELDAAVVFRCLSCNKPSLRGDDLSHRCRLCGETVGHVGALGDGCLDAVWAEAGNRVQWKATR